MALHLCTGTTSFVRRSMLWCKSIPHLGCLAGSGEGMAPARLEKVGAIQVLSLKHPPGTPVQHTKPSGALSAWVPERGTLYT